MAEGGGKRVSFLQTMDDFCGCDKIFLDAIQVGLLLGDINEDYVTFENSIVSTLPLGLSARAAARSGYWGRLELGGVTC